jgi:hypothetical protein
MLDASNVATPPPEAAVPTPLPTMVSGEIQNAPPAVTIIPAPAAPPGPSVVIAAPAASPARPQPHAGDDPGFSDQIINWMRQGDRLADPRPVENLDLSDLGEPTDPVAHELLDSQKQSVRPMARAGRVGRWASIGALGVAMSFGLYWAAQEPRSAAGFAAAPAPAAAVVETAPAPPAPVAPAPPAPAPDLAAVQLPQPAANAVRGKHKHRRNAASANPAGRTHRRHGR